LPLGELRAFETDTPVVVRNQDDSSPSGALAEMKSNSTNLEFTARTLKQPQLSSWMVAGPGFGAYYTLISMGD
jgi:hypothetical protein